MLFPTISLTSPYILFEGYVIEGSFTCRGAPAGNRSVLYSLANSFEWARCCAGVNPCVVQVLQLDLLFASFTSFPEEVLMQSASKN